jgi:plastocyanin
MIRSAALGPRAGVARRRAGKGDHVRVIVAAMTAATIVLSACGGGGSGGGGGPAADLGAAVETNAVTILDRKFDPPSIVVKVGTTVTWSNKDKSSHTVSSGVPGKRDGTFDRTLSPGREGAAEAGGVFSYTFDKAGVYTYYCQFHTTMLGQVEVK